ncbi:5-methyltetrahydropteroyltriglutamate/homocysteine S-methyltransferase [Jeotgalibacillus alimentarius]|uniref:5-methyltetrahydropteroyltriglutamate--homocysteine S-methyltransferase n=1 Tax=Jeotgalibacillus alimentarius TaxID=135826 RepID=A0A0C2W4V0_9BACL|nr:5-methyltetrahydropteroyltriglutamate--homocysteine S-methyltransferase [Jeotgalibacillus alimentarius]KIL51616.1 5-methyltetrahydropteroyltriglutamate/homocysteine S-methyltransferase [Jeotgalibacillus alimentarius]
MTLVTSTIGYPRIGEKREWKKALESHWNGEISHTELTRQMKQLRLSFIKKQRDAGIDLVPVGDFSMYDHVLDATILFGLEPERFQDIPSDKKLFAVARGTDKLPAAEMTKWFNTNYHYIVPELTDKSKPQLQHNNLLEWFLEAKEELGIHTKPVLVGPVTLLSLSKGEFDRQKLLDELLAEYGKCLKELTDAGATYIQLDEPVLALDTDEQLMNDIRKSYTVLKEYAPKAFLWLQTYFGSVSEADHLYQLPVNVIGLDAVDGEQQLLKQLKSKHFPDDKKLALGIINGRNVWKSDDERVENIIQTVLELVDQSNVILQPSCSLLHVPVSVKNESALDLSITDKLAFADEKLAELKRFALFGWSESRVNVRKKATAPVLNVPDSRVPYKERVKAQQHFNLPLFPVTTIGSFPQSKELRRKRREWKRGYLTDDGFRGYIKEQIEKWIRLQEELKLDVLVHGEFERNDMVEYFGEKLEGMAFTSNGWVQSYGSRCVKPPLIHDDIWWEEPMTVEETVFAQSLTDKPVKGMLTGPVTIAKWSFVREDCPLGYVFNQLAHAIRQEVLSLEKAGVKMIQVDEPAIREGLPLKKKEQLDYIQMAVKAFKIATSSVQPSTQIHTHMCYSSFEDSMPMISQMDADVISIEFSRSHGDLLTAFSDHAYQKGIGPGVYDIHSPRIPEVEEMTAQLHKALSVLPAELIWVNPDCGLKTRSGHEVLLALENMVLAAEQIRSEAMVRNR